MEELAALGPDWNGYGEQAITPEAIATLAWISAVPLSSGGIQLEWHTGQFDIEVEIGPDGSLRSVMSERVK
jgi:hypothetical protein